VVAVDLIRKGVYITSTPTSYFTGSISSWPSTSITKKRIFFGKPQSGSKCHTNSYTSSDSPPITYTRRPVPITVSESSVQSEPLSTNTSNSLSSQMNSSISTVGPFITTYSKAKCSF
jgi:hypothetical protein